MTDDQRFASTPARRAASTRPTPLDEDVTLAGPIEAELHVSTTGTDSDWVVKLIDVYPDDYPDPEPEPDRACRWAATSSWCAASRSAASSATASRSPSRSSRASRRRSSSRCPTSTTPSGPATGSWCRCRARWFPLVDRNPQTFVDIYTAKPTDFQKATQRVYHTAAMPSQVKVWCVSTCLNEVEPMSKMLDEIREQLAALDRTLRSELAETERLGRRCAPLLAAGRA